MLGVTCLGGDDPCEIVERARNVYLLLFLDEKKIKSHT
jgi:hypothetical protein